MIRSCRQHLAPKGCVLPGDAAAGVAILWQAADQAAVLALCAPWQPVVPAASPETEAAALEGTADHLLRLRQKPLLLLYAAVLQGPYAWARAACSLTTPRPVNG